MRSTFLFLTLASAAFGGSIVVNGDFETSNLTGWTVNPLSDDTWEVTGVAHGGSFAATQGCVGDQCINGTIDQQNFLMQTLATTLGHTYTLSFWYDPGDFTDAEGGDVTELLVLWGNTTAFDLVTISQVIAGPDFAANSTTPGVGYNFYTISGLAGGDGATVLNFLGRQDPGFANLDDISVVDEAAGGAVPEPGTYMLAAAGLLALGFKKLRA